MALEIVHGIDTLAITKTIANGRELTERQINQFAKELIKGTRDVPNIICERIRMTIKDIFKIFSVRNILGLTPFGKEVFDAYEGELYPETFPTAGEDFAYEKEILKRLIAEGNTIVIKINEQVAGTASIEARGKTRDGRNVYEIRKVVVLPDYQGIGLSEELIHLAYTKIKEKDPEAAILVITKNEKIKAICRKKWRTISYEEKRQIWKRRDIIPRVSEEQESEYKWENFYYDFHCDSTSAPIPPSPQS